MFRSQIWTRPVHIQTRKVHFRAHPLHILSSYFFPFLRFFFVTFYLLNGTFSFSFYDQNAGFMSDVTLYTTCPVILSLLHLIIQIFEKAHRLWSSPSFQPPVTGTLVRPRPFKFCSQTTSNYYCSCIHFPCACRKQYSAFKLGCLLFIFNIRSYFNLRLLFSSIEKERR